MNDQLVSFKIAKLAKKKGFDWNVRDAYLNRSKKLCLLAQEEFWEGNPVNIENPDIYTGAPTQSLLAKWLREEHDFFIHIDALYGRGSELKYNVDICRPDRNTLFAQLWTAEYLYNSYEEALEAGLLNALKLIRILN